MNMQAFLEEIFSDCDIIPSVGGRFQRHIRGLVGNMFRINNPDTVSVGNCFMEGRLKPGDLWMCKEHSGDCFQHYIYIEEYTNCYRGMPEWTFGSYGIGDSTKIELKTEEFEKLLKGGFVKKSN